jgi:hypothetical protein
MKIKPILLNFFMHWPQNIKNNWKLSSIILVKSLCNINNNWFITICMFDNAKEPLMGKHLEFMDQEKIQIKKIIGWGKI